MGKYILKRFIQIIPIFFLVSIVIFAIVRMSPTDPITVILGGKKATDAAIAAVKTKFHFDQPIAVQYLLWMRGIFTGDFGISYKYQQSVSGMIAARLPISLGLIIFSSMISILIAIPAGILCAVKKNTLIDRSISIIMVFLVSCPAFLASMLMILAMSHISGAVFTGTYANVREYFQRLTVPSLVLSFGMIALIARVSRTSMIKELKSNYVETATAKGLPSTRIIFHHTFKNAVIPVITVASIQIGAMIVGSVLVENVFALPGLGSLLITGINTSDYPIVQGITLLLVGVFLLINLLVDILYAAIDPRIRYE